MDWSILVSTFERPEILKLTLQLIRESWPNVRVTVGDQSKVKAREICREYDVHLQPLPYDCGLSACQNSLTRSAETEWVVMIDDDIKMYADLCDPEYVFRGIEKWDFIAASVTITQQPLPRKRPWIGMMEINKEGYMLRVTADKRCVVGAGWRSTDFLTPGVLFGRAKSLAAHPFCEKLKLAQGLEWCWRIRETTGPLRLGMALRQRVIHAQESGGDSYKILRKRGPEYYQKLGFEMMGVKGHKGFVRRHEMEHPHIDV